MGVNDTTHMILKKETKLKFDMKKGELVNECQVNKITTDRLLSLILRFTDWNKVKAEVKK